MKRLLEFALVTLLALPCFAQWTTVTGTNIVDPGANGAGLASGTICYRATTSFRLGGGGQVIDRPFCFAVAAGAIAGAAQVPDAQLTTPKIAYRIYLMDARKAVIRDDTTSAGIVTGPTWSYDDMTPNVTPPSSGYAMDSAIIGDLTVTGNCVGSACAADASFNLESPSLGDSGRWQHRVTNATTLRQLVCDTESGTAAVSLEIRAAPNSIGTDVLAAPLACGATVDCTAGTGCTTTFANATIPAGSFLALKIADVEGGSTLLRVHVHTQP